MIKLVILRHGESTWNKKNLFTGWTDVGLTKKGVAEAREAGKTLKRKGYRFDVAFTNLHKRTLGTLRVVLKELRQARIPVKKSWRLNERHYGALQGMNKAKIAKKFGEKQFMLWRRSYSVRPPALKKSDRRYRAMLATYKGVDKKHFPLAESLKDTFKRTLPYWKNEIVPEIKSGRKVLIVASGNSLRSLVKHLDKVPDAEIPKLNIPTGIPLVYELGASLKPLRHYYLGNQAEIRSAIEKVAAQGKAAKQKLLNKLFTGKCL